MKRQMIFTPVGEEGGAHSYNVKRFNNLGQAILNAEKPGDKNVQTVNLSGAYRIDYTILQINKHTNSAAITELHAMFGDKVAVVGVTLNETKEVHADWLDKKNKAFEGDSIIELAEDRHFTPSVEKAIIEAENSL